MNSLIKLIMDWKRN